MKIEVGKNENFKTRSEIKQAIKDGIYATTRNEKIPERYYDALKVIFEEVAGELRISKRDREFQEVMEIIEKMREFNVALNEYLEFENNALMCVRCGGTTIYFVEDHGGLFDTLGECLTTIITTTNGVIK